MPLMELLHIAIFRTLLILKFSEKLKGFLRPFAEQKKVVSDTDIHEFFNQLSEKKNKNQ